MFRAAIDIGSNSIILLVSKLSGSRWISVFEDTRVTGLGKGTKVSGRLDPSGAEHSIVAIQEFSEKAHVRGATEVRAAATMAVRIAEDGPEFIAKVRQLGVNAAVLSGDDEARLGFLSVVNDPQYAFNHDETIAMVDPGGHSTEIVIGTRSKIQFQKSFSVGALGLRESALRDDRCTAKDRMIAATEIDRTICSLQNPIDVKRVFTLGATGVNLVSLREKYEKWNPTKIHGSGLSYEEISRAFNWLADMDDAERAALTGLEKGREHTIHAGAIILERALFALGAEACTVSIRGWRHGLLELEQWPY